jgi:hypothetical protein
MGTVFQPSTTDWEPLLASRTAGCPEPSSL